MRAENVIALSVLLAGGAAAAYWLYLQSVSSGDATSDLVVAGDGTADDFLGNIEANVVSTVSGWKNVGSGPTWLYMLGAAENAHGLPADLLARMAYQESHFREEIIRGTLKSPAGALGILQLMPQYFQSVNVATPYSDDDVNAQIDEAAQQMRSLYEQFESWPLALAGYNAGAGNVKKYGGIPPFAETQNYVAEISADVPSLGIV